MFHATPTPVLFGLSFRQICAGVRNPPGTGYLAWSLHSLTILLTTDVLTDVVVPSDIGVVGDLESGIRIHTQENFIADYIFALSMEQE